LQHRLRELGAPVVAEVGRARVPPGVVVEIGLEEVAEALAQRPSGIDRDRLLMEALQLLVASDEADLGGEGHVLRESEALFLVSLEVMPVAHEVLAALVQLPGAPGVAAQAVGLGLLVAPRPGRDGLDGRGQEHLQQREGQQATTKGMRFK
jgi:hypothetical protein